MKHKGGKDCATCGTWSRILLNDLCQQCAAKYVQKVAKIKNKG